MLIKNILQGCNNTAERNGWDTCFCYISSLESWYYSNNNKHIQTKHYDHYLHCKKATTKEHGKWQSRKGYLVQKGLTVMNQGKWKCKVSVRPVGAWQCIPRYKRPWETRSTICGNKKLPFRVGEHGITTTTASIYKQNIMITICAARKLQQRNMESDNQEKGIWYRKA